MEQIQVSQPFKKRIIEAPSYKQQNQGGLIRPQQQGPPGNIEILKIVEYEPPMMLNAWTQTSSDDFPPIPSNKEAELLANIQKLEEKLKIQADMIDKMNQSNNQSRTPVRLVSQPNTPPPVEYRILNKIDGNKEIIEIELSEDCKTSDQKENTFVEHMYARIAESPTLASKNKIKGPLVSIGPNGTQVPAVEYKKLTWTSASIATRKLLGLIFDRETLATHSMTGKASPAFRNLHKPVKRQLDSRAIEDVILLVTRKCAVSAKEVRSAITTKCADENKMMKLKALKNIEPKRSILSEKNKNRNDNT